ncbi:hypothetical protein TURU_000490 [Turdus rufiventris]|nr:hypothetical protein TURU_000490 [Turdus rufiventris]
MPFPAAQEVLDNLKDRWYQADNPPPDLLLSEQEFLSFLHPEHSRGMLHFMVQEIIRDLGNRELIPGSWIHGFLGIGFMGSSFSVGFGRDWCVGVSRFYVAAALHGAGDHLR